jgi:CHAT domain-containing protein/Tfp pilus assembly protein PilF
MLNAGWNRLLMVWILLGTGVYLLEIPVAGKTIAIAQTAKDPKTESDRWYEQGVQQFRQALYRESRQSLQQALTFYRQQQNQIGEAQTLTQLSEVHYWQGQYQSALEIAQQALDLWRKLGDRNGETTALERLAEAQSEVEGYPRALETLQPVLMRRREMGDRPGEGKTLLRIGTIFFKYNQPAAAEAALQQAQAILQKADPFESSLALGWLGWVQFNQGDKVRGSATLAEALQLSRETNNRAVEFLTLLFTAETYFQQKEYARALEFYQQGLPMVARSGNRPGKAYVLRAIANMHRQLKQPEKALQAQQQAIAVYQKELADRQSLNDPAMTGEIHNLIGTTYFNGAQYPEAIAAYQQALADYQKVNTASGQQDRSANVAQVWKNLGEAYFRAEQYPQSLDAHQQALTIYQTLNRPADMARMFADIGYLYRQQKQYPQSLEAYQQALDLHRQLNQPAQVSETLSSIGNLYNSQAVDAQKKQDYLQAIALMEPGITSFQQALEVARQTGDRRLEMRQLFALGRAYGTQGNNFYGAGKYDQVLPLYHQDLSVVKQAKAIAEALKDTDTTRQITDWLFHTYSGFVNIYKKLNQYDNALASLKEMQTIAEETRDPEQIESAKKSEYGIYLSLVNVYNQPEQYDQYLEALRKVIELAQQLQRSNEEVFYTKGIASVYRFRGQYAEALAIYQQVLSRARELGDLETATFALQFIGLIHSDQANYARALTVYEQALQLGRQRQNQISILSTQNNIATIYERQGKYTEAETIHQQNLATFQQLEQQLAQGMTPTNLRWLCTKNNGFRDPDGQKRGSYPTVCETPDQLPAGFIGDGMKGMIAGWRGVTRSATATGFHNLASLATNRGDYPQALALYQQGLAIVRELGEREREGNTLNMIANVYSAQGDYTRAKTLLQEALAIALAQGDGSREVVYRANLSEIDARQGKFSEALAAQQQLLARVRQWGQRSREARFLVSIANLHRYKGEYAQAFAHYQQALDLQATLGEPETQLQTLSNLGLLHRELGQLEAALKVHQQALAISQKIGTRPHNAALLQAIATIYQEQDKPDLALQHYQQALAIAQDLGDLLNQSRSLYGIGRLYLQQSQAKRGLEALEQAARIQQRIGLQADLAATLAYLGQAQTQLKQTAAAATTLQQALSLAQASGDRPTEARALSHLGELFNRQTQPEIAITFYKQAVNVRETIRTGIRNLSREQQESYTQTVAETYRTLADLLLSRGRILEAQQVLELLKVQEIRDFTRDTRAGGETTGISLSPTEQAIVDQYGSLIAFGYQVEQCRQTNCARLGQMDTHLKALTQAYNRTIDKFQAEIRQRRGDDKSFYDPELLGEAQRIVETAQKQTGVNTVLIYPLVLDQKLWLLWVSAGGVVKSQPVDVGQAELAKAVLEFRQQMQVCAARRCGSADTAQLQAVSQKLHGWLIQPIAGELKKNNVKNLIFSLDRMVRYIPMAALHDGKQYLIENYTVSTILSAALTSDRARAPFTRQQTEVLALGVSDAIASFSPLPNVPIELAAIVGNSSANSPGIYSGLEFLNRAFNENVLRQKLNTRQHRIVHIATHGKFIPGNHLASFLLLGDSKKLTVDEIRALPLLSGVDLVVLSACESALGGAEAVNPHATHLDGIEISSMSFHFLNRQARAVLASLWLVNDTSTSLLMQQFYNYLAEDTPQQPVTKTEALRQAQLSLLQGKVTARDAIARSDIEVQSMDNQPPADFSHPYYWAPFILIGNSL